MTIVYSSMGKVRQDVKHNLRTHRDFAPKKEDGNKKCNNGRTPRTGGSLNSFSNKKIFTKNMNLINNNKKFWNLIKKDIFSST